MFSKIKELKAGSCQVYQCHSFANHIRASREPDETGVVQAVAQARQVELGYQHPYLDSHEDTNVRLDTTGKAVRFVASL